MWKGAAGFALATGLALSGEARAQTTFEAVLLGSNEVPGPGQHDGSALATLTVEGRTVTLTIKPDGFTDRLAAHIHKGAAGVAGRLVVEFPWTASASGSAVTLTAQAPAGLAAKVAANPQRYYAEIHTTSFPAGAARGQLHVSTGPAQPAGLSSLPAAGQVIPPPDRLGLPAWAVGQPLVGAGGERLPAPGFGTSPGRFPASARPEPRPQPRPSSRMTWEFVFRHFTPDDERAAGLIETEVPVLRQVADDCEQALAQLDLQQADERPGILDAHIALLRSRLGEAAFSSLDSYVQKTFEGDRDGPSPSIPPSQTPRKDQTLRFPPPPSKTYRDPDFGLKASSSSGLRVYFTASGDCSVHGSSVHLLSAGNCWVTAHQPGNEEFNPAPDAVQWLRIEKDDQWISGPAIPPRTYLDPDFPLSTTASSGLPVVFQTTGRCIVDRGFVHLLGAGTCSLTAHQPGDSNFTAAPIADQEFTIAKADQTISIPDYASAPYGPADFPLNARASSGLPVRIATTGTCAFNGVSLLILGPGTCTVTVSAHLKARKSGQEPRGSVGFATGQ